MTFSTDWLGMNTYYFNDKTCLVSKNINDVIDYKNFAFDPDGLINYLDFGYSVFGQTPIKDVKFLLPNSNLVVNHGHIFLEEKEDVVESYVNVKSSTESTLSLIRKEVNKWENSFESEIVIPTSGGYDSRLLNSMVENKDRIRSYSYGVSRDQSKSYEVVFANKISELLHTNWKHITLGDYHSYIDMWLREYGCSVHAHGMYQIEFYSKVRKLLPNSIHLLSGIIGDAWAGSVNIPPINSVSELTNLGYSHGMVADSKECKISADLFVNNKYFIKNKLRLQNPKLRIIESMRMKIILLGYLYRVPECFGFIPWSPFLDVRVAMSMLNLPDSERLNRKWQTRYFKDSNLDVENLSLDYSKVNYLNILANIVNPPKLLDSKLLSKTFNVGYLDYINEQMSKFSDRNFIMKIWDGLLENLTINGLVKKVGLPGYFEKELKAYYSYLVILPLQNALTRSKYEK